MREDWWLLGGWSGKVNHRIDASDFLFMSMLLLIMHN